MHSNRSADGIISVISITAGTLLTRLDRIMVNTDNDIESGASPSPNPGMWEANSDIRPEWEAPPIRTKRPMKNSSMLQSILPASHLVSFGDDNMITIAETIPATAAT